MKKLIINTLAVIGAISLTGVFLIIGACLFGGESYEEEMEET